MPGLDVLLSWVMRRVPPKVFQAIAAALHRNPLRRNCLARRQGRCPGLEFCPDCPWSEGTSRELG